MQNILRLCAFLSAVSLVSAALWFEVVGLAITPASALLAPFPGWLLLVAPELFPTYNNLSSSRALRSRDPVDWEWVGIATIAAAVTWAGFVVLS